MQHKKKAPWWGILLMVVLWSLIIVPVVWIGLVAIIGNTQSNSSTSNESSESGVSGSTYDTYEASDSNSNNEQCSIKGNISYNTGEKIYHMPEDKYYANTEIDTSDGEKWFCTESEARSAGWRRTYE